MTERDQRVTIVMPAYRAAQWLPGAVRSVQAQTFREWELLIVEDRSPDATHAVATALAAEEPRIRVLVNAREQGPAGARTTGIAAARGRFLAFLDSDDLWMPTKLERQLADLRATGGGFSFTAYRRIDESGTRVGRLVEVPRELDHRRLLGNTAIVTSSVLLDRERVGRVVPRPTYHDDFVLWLDLLRGGGVAHGLNEDLIRYRIAGGSYSRNKFRMAWHVWRTYRDIEGLGIGTSLGHFLGYAVRGVRKRLTY